MPTFRTNDWCVFRIFADTLEIWTILRMNLNDAAGSQRWRMACKGCSADTTTLVSLQHRQLVDDPMNSRVSACGEMTAARTPNAQSPKSATGHAGCGKGDAEGWHERAGAARSEALTLAEAWELSQRW
jgi:hypothetical protein